jgi:hypothetical protein
MELEEILAAIRQAYGARVVEELRHGLDASRFRAYADAEPEHKGLHILYFSHNRNTWYHKLDTRA